MGLGQSKLGPWCFPREVAKTGASGERLDEASGAFSLASFSYSKGLVADGQLGLSG